MAICQGNSKEECAGHRTSDLFDCTKSNDMGWVSTCNYSIEENLL